MYRLITLILTLGAIATTSMAAAAGDTPQRQAEAACLSAYRTEKTIISQPAGESVVEYRCARTKYGAEKWSAVTQKVEQGETIEQAKHEVGIVGE